jgi:hypothetical protein
VYFCYPFKLTPVGELSIQEDIVSDAGLAPEL